MRFRTHARTLCSLLLAILLIAACNGPADDEGEAPLFDDAALDAAAVDEVVPAPVVPTGEVTPLEDASSAGIRNTEAAASDAQAVLPEAEGVIIHTRHDAFALEPWSVVLYDLATEQTLEVYRGQREVQSVAIDGQDTAVLAAQRTADDDSGFDVFRADLQAGTISRLTDGAADARNVSTDTDGTLVAWEGAHEGRRAVVWRDFAADQAYVLDTNLEQTQPSLSGNGQHVAFVQEEQGGTKSVLLFLLANDELLEVHTSTAPLRHPSASDDLGTIAWMEDTGNGGAVRTWMQGTGVATEFDDPDGVRHLHLADSGRWMAYAVQDAGAWRLHTRDVQEDRTEPGPAATGDDGAAYWRLAYDCTVTPSGLTASGHDLRPTGLTCDSE